MRVIVTGPRGWKGNSCFVALHRAMSRFAESHDIPDTEPITLVEGEADGFDKMSRTIAESLGWEVEPYPVETWYPGGSFNPEAGHQRNQLMVDSGGDFALAGILPCEKPEHASQEPHFTHGTADCMDRLDDAGIPVERVYPDGTH